MTAEVDALEGSSDDSGQARVKRQCHSGERERLQNQSDA